MMYIAAGFGIMAGFFLLIVALVSGVDLLITRLGGRRRRNRLRERGIHLC